MCVDMGALSVQRAPSDRMCGGVAARRNPCRLAPHDHHGTVARRTVPRWLFAPVVPPPLCCPHSASARRGRDHAMFPIAVFIVDTSFAMLGPYLGGTCSDTPVVHPHGAGVLPYPMDCVPEPAEGRRQGSDHMTKPSASHNKRVSLGFVVPPSPAMCHVLECVGSEPLISAIRILGALSGPCRADNATAGMGRSTSWQRCAVAISIPSWVSNRLRPGFPRLPKGGSECS